jgi:hypothetical protein
MINRHNNVTMTSQDHINDHINISLVLCMNMLLKRCKSTNSQRAQVCDTPYNKVDWIFVL